MTEPCPNCGYCPTCGRKNEPLKYVYPINVPGFTYPVYPGTVWGPWGPWYVGALPSQWHTGMGTVGGSDTITGGGTAYTGGGTAISGVVAE